MQKKLLLLIVLLAAILLAGCTREPPSQPVKDNTTSGAATYQEMSVEQLKTQLANKDFVFVNVHIPFEGDIASTDLSIPYNEITDNLDQLPADKDAKIVLYCRSGRMSAIAAEQLAGLGYTNVWDVPGGMVAWEQAGYPLAGE